MMNGQILTQPSASAPLNLGYAIDEKQQNFSGSDRQHQCQDRQCQSSHGHCHASRRRRMLWIALLSLLSLFTLMGLFCAWHSNASWLADWGLAPSDFMKRAVSDGTSGNDSTFIDRKYYLIVIFVGLFIVLILGICLSAWCCKGSFQNPLCCPCYLCACCGGLACLECIGCGLCAEGLENA